MPLPTQTVGGWCDSTGAERVCSDYRLRYSHWDCWFAMHPTDMQLLLRRGARDRAQGWGQGGKVGRDKAVDWSNPALHTRNAIPDPWTLHSVLQ